MRAFDKKKQFRLDCKRMVQHGRMPNADGQWIMQTGSAGQHIAAGHGTKRK
jgi:hypothetical protein